MNYTFIPKPWPYFVRIVGYLIAGSTITIALLEKYQIDVLPDSVSLKLVQSIFLISLVLILNSNQKTEDERTLTIRFGIATSGFYLLVFFLIFLEVMEVFASYTFSSINIYSGLLMYLMLVLIAYEILIHTQLMDVLEQHKKILRYLSPFFALLVGFLMLEIMRMNAWLWGWEKLGG